MWQPIETAPKDGTIVILYADQGADGAWCGIHVASWNNERSGGSSAPTWQHVGYQNLGQEVSGRPTHWMPLMRDPHGRCVNEIRNERYPWLKSPYQVTPR